MWYYRDNGETVMKYPEARALIVEELIRRRKKVSWYRPQEIERAAYELIERLKVIEPAKPTKPINPTYPKHWAD